MNPLVSAIVLNYRTPKDAVLCVQALLEQTIAADMEILVIDNHSNDDSIGILRNRLKLFPTVRILEERTNVGFGRGYNLGIAHATGTYLLLNNPAKKLRPESLEIMVEAMEKDSGIGIIGPKLVYDDGTIRESFRAFPSFLDVLSKRTVLRHLFPGRVRHYLQSDADPETAKDVDWVVGGCLLMRHDVASALRGFDPRFFLFFEDIDLCRRCSALGKRVRYLPQAIATDRKKRLSEGSAWFLPFKRIGRAHIASAVRYFWKWRS